MRHIMDKNAPPPRDVAATKAKGLSDADRAEIDRDVERAKQKSK